MDNFLRLYKESVYKTEPAFVKLLRDYRYLRYGCLAVLISATLYTLVYVFLVLGGGRPFKPWLDIPEDVYYRYNVFFLAPSMFLGWILATGVVHTIMRCLTHIGAFEQLLALFAFGISLASWTTGIHDLVSSFLGAVNVIDQNQFERTLNSPTPWRTLLWVLMAAYAGFFVWFFSRAVKVVYDVGNRLSVAIGVLGFSVYQLFFFIFNR